MKHTFKELIDPKKNDPNTAVQLLLEAFGTPQSALNAINYTSACIVSASATVEHIKAPKEVKRGILISYTGDIKWQKIIADKLKSLCDEQDNDTESPDNGIDEVI